MIIVEQFLVELTDARVADQAVEMAAFFIEINGQFSVIRKTKKVNITNSL
ncbi:uncharacterized membrane protein YcaP (DUF421 family) [Neobacillus niacini]|nr:uncharacterized membrane protein YcaP (DUF421 family) [Neobacillus niacini]